MLWILIKRRGQEALYQTLIFRAATKRQSQQIGRFRSEPPQTFVCQTKAPSTKVLKEDGGPEMPIFFSVKFFVLRL